MTQTLRVVSTAIFLCISKTGELAVEVELNWVIVVLITLAIFSLSSSTFHSPCCPRIIFQKH